MMDGKYERKVGRRKKGEKDGRCGALGAFFIFMMEQKLIRAAQGVRGDVKGVARICGIAWGRLDRR